LVVARLAIFLTVASPAKPDSHRGSELDGPGLSSQPMFIPTPKPFPTGFVWGAATSSYQIEGATRADGRGDSIWDVFAGRGGTFQSQSGEPACDHYHRIDEDVAIMRQMGLKAYRFSIAWPRIQPSGPGPATDAGLAFYDKLVNALIANKIQPFVTLYHWDMPQWLSLRGGRVHTARRRSTLRPCHPLDDN
jgi:beta-glucosidase/6-phospho-beta-glucosidase/beta-galactosidase